MPDKAQIDTYIAAKQDEAIAELARLCAVPSVSAIANKPLYLNGLDQFALTRDLGVRFLAFEHPI